MVCNCGCNQRKKCSKKSYGSYTKYVKGGLCESGDGSKCRPWNSLALAQAGSWETLVVLSSPIALDGGILLKNGQKLVGEKSPVDGPLSYDQPTITNTDLLSNRGNGVLVQSGSVVVKNLHITNTQTSAINYDNAKDLFVKEVLVTGHNQSETLVTTDYTDHFGQTEIPVAGIHGQNSQSGKTTLCKVMIRDNHTGPGVYDAPFGAITAITRKLKVIKSNFSGLKSTQTFNTGVLAASSGVGTKSVVKIYKSTAADFKAAIRNIGFTPQVYRGSEIDFTVEKSKMLNLNVESSTRGWGIYGYSTDSVEDADNKLTLRMICSVVKNKQAGQGGDSGNGAFTVIRNGDLVTYFKDNTMYDVRSGYLSDFINGNNQNENFYNNNIISSGITLIFNTFRNSGINKNFNAIVKNNNLKTIGGVGVIFFEDVNNTENFFATIENNCIEMVNGRFSAILIINFDKENLNFNIHKNNIISNDFLIFVDGPPDPEPPSAVATVNASNNYFSPAPVEGVNILNVTSADFTFLPTGPEIVCPDKKYCVEIYEPILLQGLSSNKVEKSLDERLKEIRGEITFKSLNK